MVYVLNPGSTGALVRRNTPGGGGRGEGLSVGERSPASRSRRQQTWCGVDKKEAEVHYLKLQRECRSESTNTTAPARGRSGRGRGAEQAFTPGVRFLAICICVVLNHVHM